MEIISITYCGSSLVDTNRSNGSKIKIVIKIKIIRSPKNNCLKFNLKIPINIIERIEATIIVPLP